MPDDSGLALIQPAVPATPAHHKHKVARHTWAIEAAGTQIVVRPGATVPASASTPVAPDETVVAKQQTAKKKPATVGGPRGRDDGRPGRDRRARGHPGARARGRTSPPDSCA